MFDPRDEPEPVETPLDPRSLEEPPDAEDAEDEVYERAER